MEVIAFFKSVLLRVLQKMVMQLLWIHKSSSRALFIEVQWNPRSVSSSCFTWKVFHLFSEFFWRNCFQKFHGNLLAESYLANLALYPGRSELPFLPANTQVPIHFILEMMLHRSIYSSNWYSLYHNSWFLLSSKNKSWMQNVLIYGLQCIKILLFMSRSWIQNSDGGVNIFSFL